MVVMVVVLLVLLAVGIVPVDEKPQYQNSSGGTQYSRPYLEEELEFATVARYCTYEVARYFTRSFLTARAVEGGRPLSRLCTPSPPETAVLCTSYSFQ